MRHRHILTAIAAGALTLGTMTAHAQDTIKIGFVQSLTGPFSTVGKAAVNGARLYMQLHGDMVAGKKIEMIVKDDGSVPDVGKRLAQDLIVNDKIAILGGGITPSALTVAPLATKAKIPMVVMVSGASITTERSPYIVRTSFTTAQSSAIIADWAIKNGAKKIVTLVNEWAPGTEAEQAFKDRVSASNGRAQIVESLRAPLQSPDFAPFLQRALDAKPDTLFAYVPGNMAGILAKQFRERGMDKSGIQIIGPGDITDDDELPTMGDQMLGIVTAHHYSAAHDSALNMKYVAAYEKAFGRRPNFISVGGYDGMNLIYEALKKTGGKTDAEGLIAAMKGMQWESPRGLISIDPETRDIVQNEYIRKVEKKDGQLYNIEFATFEAVKDPEKEKKKKK